ncbi:MAG: class I SAM-dependent methyltransferase [Anaerolineales bacterium]|nr:class I SAM-dependent methyltransferase [Anaerolineales bacterium]
MEQVNCDLCGGKETRPVYTVVDNNYGTPGSFSLVTCTACGLVYQNPRPTAVEISAYYPTAEYHPFRALQEQKPPEPQELHWKRAKRLTALQGPGSVLDVGCGSGLFLAAMRSLGWTVCGVDPNPDVVQYVRQVLQIEAYEGDIFTVPEEERVNLVTFWDVLEHTHSPTAVLRRAHQLLQPEGYLALNVPNWASIERHLFKERWIALDAPRHLYHFTPQTLSAMLRACGFQPLVVQPQAPVLSLASNMLRWIGDTFLRQGQSKQAVLATAPTPTAPPAPSPAKQRLIRLVHLAMRPPNFLFNTLNRGSAITVIAQKDNIV